MSRVFGRGQLKLALLQVAADLGPSNGYVIMHELGGRIGGRWQPSPGAIYPALLALEDAGMLRGEDVDGGRAYSVTDAGRRAIDASPDVIDVVADRARTEPEPTAAPAATIGSVLDRLAAEAPNRDLEIDDAAVRRIETRFRSVLTEIGKTAAKVAGAATPNVATSNVKETSNG